MNPAVNDVIGTVASRQFTTDMNVKSHFSSPVGVAIGFMICKKDARIKKSKTELSGAG